MSTRSLTPICTATPPRCARRWRARDCVSPPAPLRAPTFAYLNGARADRRVAVVPRTGWHRIAGRKRFVLPGASDGEQTTVIVAGAALSPHTATGTIPDWQRSVARLAAGPAAPCSLSRPRLRRRSSS